MTKTTLSELIDGFASLSGLTKKEAERMIHAMPAVIRNGLKDQGIVKIKDFGTFKVRKVEVRKGRNLKTGEEVIVPSQNKVTFTPDPVMRDFINKYFKDLDYIDIEAEEITHQPKEEIASKIEYQKEEPSVNIADEVTPVVIYDETEEHHGAVPPSFEAKTGAEEKEEEFTVPETPMDVEDVEITEPKSKYLWIIPTVLGVVITLMIIFYFRTCNVDVTTTPREPVNTAAEEKITAQPAVISADTTYTKTDSTFIPDSAIIISDSSLKEQTAPDTELPQTEKPAGVTYKVQPGNYLYQMAGQFYGDSLLWVLIYKANQDQIPNPDGYLVGKELIIPNLEGDRYHLTRNDSSNISEGYRLLYEYYTAKNSPVAPGFKWATNHYKPR